MLGVLGFGVRPLASYNDAIIDTAPEVEAEQFLGGGGFSFWSDRAHKKLTKKEKREIIEIIETAEELILDSKLNSITNKKLDKYTSMLVSIEEILTVQQKNRVQYIQQQQQKIKYMIYARAALLT